ncbi:unnamed protein product [Microthlaspi erraticum]|uniref:Uncharacterized protein n=1 Tax=Microthlaspi erraticum TaxID=1685480 RepID=A0A6D2HKY2_9BRAS|nr:unnamed protein product [Microthlaspi erraticum]
MMHHSPPSPKPNPPTPNPLTPNPPTPPDQYFSEISSLLRRVLSDSATFLSLRRVLSQAPPPSAPPPPGFRSPHCNFSCNINESMVRASLAESKDDWRGYVGKAIFVQVLAGVMIWKTKSAYRKDEKV